MYKITLEKMGSDFTGTIPVVIKEFTFETKKEANKAFKELVKQYEMTSNSMLQYWNTTTFLELKTNYQDMEMKEQIRKEKIAILKRLITLNKEYQSLIKYYQEFNMKNDLIFVGLVLVAICFSLESYQNNQELKRIHKLVEVERTAKIEAMKLAIDINNTLEIHREMNLSLNVEIDRLMNEIQELKGDKQLLKDIRRHWSER